jgi:hypothetical protein
MFPLQSRHWILSSLMAALMLTSSVAAQAQIMPSAHVSLKSPRAQRNREQIFNHLMTGSTPSFMRGKSQRQINAWSTRMKKAILRNGQKVVRSIVANPSAAPSSREQKILGLLTPMQRAALLKTEAGFTVKKIKYKVGGVPTDKLKIVLKRFGQGNYSYGGNGNNADYKKQMDVYTRVMSPNLVTYAPAGAHSKYVSKGKMFDIWSGSSAYGDLRPNKYPLFPTWLSDGESKRMQQVAELSKGWNSYSSPDHALGSKHAHGIKGMWPPNPTQRKQASNSCTTVFIRAPVGQRDPAFGWIDKLQAKVTSAAKAGRLSVDGVDMKKVKLLDAVTGKTKTEYTAIFDKVKRALPGEARGLGKLRGEVDFFASKLKKGSGSSYGYYNNNNNNSSTSTDPKSLFPMDLMHRAPLSKIAGITGDPLGPGMGKQKFRAADPMRLGVVTVFEKQR